MKLCIVGTGKIANEVAHALQSEAPEIEITGVYAHSNKEKADKMAAEFNIPKVYTDYEQLLRDDEADFIYLGVVNTAHYEYAKAALLAGRNVIVEKPFTTTYKEAVELADLARSRHLWLFEAVTTLHLSNYKQVKEWLEEIAPVRIVQCNYSQYSSRYDRYLNGDVAPAFNPELGGGALNDLNVYNINAVVGLFGRPENVSYYANRGFNGVDTSGVLVMEYNGMTAVCTAAKDSSCKSSTIIQGEKGTIVIASAPNEVSEVILKKAGYNFSSDTNKYWSRLIQEFKDFEEYFATDNRKAMDDYLDTSLSVMKVLEQASGKAPNNGSTEF